MKKEELKSYREPKGFVLVRTWHFIAIMVMNNVMFCTICAMVIARKLGF